MKILILLTILICSGCKVTTGNDVTSSSSFTSYGACHLYQGLFQTAVCVEYSSDFSNTQVDTDCDALNTHYSAHSITSHSSSYNPLILTCDSSGRVGLCRVNNKRIRYYSREWTSVQAETDCTSLGGNFGI
jgi:hypothetical protein